TVTRLLSISTVHQPAKPPACTEHRCTPGGSRTHAFPTPWATGRESISSSGAPGSGYRRTPPGPTRRSCPRPSTTAWAPDRNVISSSPWPAPIRSGFEPVTTSKGDDGCEETSASEVVVCNATHLFLCGETDAKGSSMNKLTWGVATAVARSLGGV